MCHKHSTASGDPPEPEPSALPNTEELHREGRWALPGRRPGESRRRRAGGVGRGAGAGQPGQRRGV